MILLLAFDNYVCTCCFTTLIILISWNSNQEVPIWHGVNPWGEKSHYNCDDWNSDNPLHVGLASNLEGGLIGKNEIFP